MGRIGTVPLNLARILLGSASLAGEWDLVQIQAIGIGAQATNHLQIRREPVNNGLFGKLRNPRRCKYSTRLLRGKPTEWPGYNGRMVNAFRFPFGFGWGGNRIQVGRGVVVQVNHRQKARFQAPQGLPGCTRSIAACPIGGFLCFGQVGQVEGQQQAIRRLFNR